MHREKDPKHRVTSQPRKANHVPFKSNKCFYQCYPFLKNSVQVRFEDEIIDQQTIQCVLPFIFSFSLKVDTFVIVFSFLHQKASIY